jgi:hypothetical protein
MNASQRRSIANIAAQIESLRSLIENIVDDENDKYDSLPESFRW